MGNTLQDQLLKAGLANKKQAVRAKKAKNNKEKLQRQGNEVVDATAESVRQAEADRVERDRQLNQRKNDEANQKAIQAQIRQLIELNALQEDGDQAFQFEVEGVIKTLYTTASIRKQLAKGVLAVSKAPSGDGHAVIAREVAEKITQRDESWIVCLHQSSAEHDIPDEYSEYQIPDDLMW